MMSRSMLICFICISHFFTTHLFAQDIKSNSSGNIFFPQKRNVDTTIAIVGYPDFAFKNKLFLIDSPLFSAQTEPHIESGVHYTTFFCKMETTLRSHLNIWVKVRAGNDDLYRQITAERYE